MRTRVLLLALGLLAAAGCVRMPTPNQRPELTLEPATQPVCPEYRNLGCMTAPQCQLDTARKCQVCVCAPAAVPPTQRPQEGQPLGTPTNPAPSTNPPHPGP